MYEHIAPENPRAALDQLDEIETQVRLLIANPRLGRAGRQPGTRELIIARTPYLTVYQLGKELIEIIRIIHGAQHWPPGAWLARRSSVQVWPTRSLPKE